MNKQSKKQQRKNRSNLTARTAGQTALFCMIAPTEEDLLDPRESTVNTSRS